MKAATVYSRLGWAVVPLHSVVAGVCSCSEGASCRTAGKHPRLRDWAERATADATTVAGWISQWPGGNIGIATGEASGFFALDVDPKNGGPASLAALGQLPRTVEARTGSGGSHYLFQLPDFAVGNSSGKVGPGLDIRGDGGQIVVAPSVSAKGAYTWVNPPWNTEIAEAPSWLLERLQAAPAARQEEVQAPRVALRFPPASPEVLAGAAEALEAHGPAVEGQGGDQHTFVAAALLVNDWALTEDEAWPLLLEWNATCEPPWSEDDLAAKLRGGAKYASRPFGCRRSVDALAAAKAEIAAWQAAGADEGAMLGMLERVRALAAVCGDPSRWAIIQRDLGNATGLGPRGVNLPPLETPREDAPTGSIEVTPRIHEMADQATKAILPAVFARNGVLCEVVNGQRLFIHDLDAPRILDLASRAAKWVRFDEKRGMIQTPPPAVVSTVLQARRTHEGVRVLDAITTSPVFLADGSILQERGYNAQARVYLDPSVQVDVPEAPTREHARAAVAMFEDLLCNFRFATPADRSSWLAGLLTPLVKSAIDNAPAPLVCVSAASPGAGKTLLTDVAARIITGGAAEVRPYNPKDPSEWGKRVTAYVRMAAPINVFDNCNGAFGDETLDRLVTSSTWSDRVLGASEAPPIAVTGSWWATGNNIEPVADTVRRVLMCRIEVEEDRPQERSDFKRPLLLEYTTAHRSELLTAALTILRAYHVAGRPDQHLATWGSFATWSALVRGALVWAGCADPFETQQRAASEMNEADFEAHDFWIDTIGQTDGTATAIATLANQRDAAGILGTREQLKPFTLRKFLSRFVDRPRLGHRIRRSKGTYYVEKIMPSGPGGARSPGGAAA